MGLIRDLLLGISGLLFVLMWLLAYAIRRERMRRESRNVSAGHLTDTRGPGLHKIDFRPFEQHQLDLPSRQAGE
jgi:hypothetical protein